MQSDLPGAFTTAVSSLHTAGEWMMVGVDKRVYSIVHSILVAHKLRQSEVNGRAFALKYPIASCATHFIVSQFGSITSNFLLGIPPIEVCTSPMDLFLSFLVWYLVFFSPFDFVDALLNLLPLRILLEVIHEVKRAINVHLGVSQAAMLYPNAWTAMALIGTIRGSGTSWGITFSRLITSSPLAGEHELIKFVAATRISLLAGVLLGLSQAGVLELDALALLAVLATVMIAVRLGTLLYQLGDPFSYSQGMLWKLFIYGVQQDADNTDKDISGDGLPEYRPVYFESKTLAEGERDSESEATQGVDPDKEGLQLRRSSRQKKNN